MEEGSFVFINRNYDMKEEFHVVTDSIVNSLDLRGSYKRKHKRLNRVGKHKNIRIEVNIKALIQDSINNNGIGKGSGRSVYGIPLGKIILEALKLKIISSGGGHDKACGASIPKANIKKFIKNLNLELEK